MKFLVALAAMMSIAAVPSSFQPVKWPDRPKAVSTAEARPILRVYTCGKLQDCVASSREFTTIVNRMLGESPKQVVNPLLVLRVVPARGQDGKPTEIFRLILSCQLVPTSADLADSSLGQVGGHGEGYWSFEAANRFANNQSARDQFLGEIRQYSRQAKVPEGFLIHAEDRNAAGEWFFVQAIFFVLPYKK